MCVRRWGCIARTRHRGWTRIQVRRRPSRRWVAGSRAKLRAVEVNEQQTARQGYGCLASIVGTILLFVGLAGGFASETSSEAAAAWVLVLGGVGLWIAASVLRVRARRQGRSSP